MSEEVKVETSEDVMDLVFKLTQFEMRYPDWAKREALNVVNQEIVDKIRNEMETKGYDKKIIERVRAEVVKIDTDGFIEIDVISDYEAEGGFDVAKMMEEGRTAYTVLPKVKRALHWIAQGLSIFSRRSDIPQKPPGEDVKSAIEEMEDLAQDRLDEKTDELLESSLEN